MEKFLLDTAQLGDKAGAMKSKAANLEDIASNIAGYDTVALEFDFDSAKNVLRASVQTLKEYVEIGINEIYNVINKHDEVQQSNLGFKVSFGYFSEPHSLSNPCPAADKINSDYGRTAGRDHAHGGLDLGTYACNINGSSVLAAAPGKVITAQYSNSYGNYVIIEHESENGNTYQTLYAHMQNNSLNVQVGQIVNAGDLLGKVGSTGNSSGPHLHFEVRVNGKTVDPKTYYPITSYNKG